MSEITQETWAKELQGYMKRCPSSWVMIRSDRPGDLPHGCYPDTDSRRKGDEAMRNWFEYLFAKDFRTIIRGWVALLRAGMPIMVVCPDPVSFDLAWAPGKRSSLPPLFFDGLMAARLRTEADKRRMVGKFEALQRSLKYVPAPCSPKTCPRKFGEECPRAGQGICRSRDKLPYRGINSDEELRECF